MFTVHIHTKNGLPATENGYAALKGFESLGCFIMHYENEDDLSHQLRLNDCVVGYISDAIYALDRMDIQRPETIDYPEELDGFYGRKIWKDRLSSVANHPEKWPIFTKSVNQKGFTGVVVKTMADLRGTAHQNVDREVFCSEVVEFVSEWRGFVKRGQIVDVRGYKGRWDVYPDPVVMRRAMEAWTTAPAGCCIDFGVTADGRTLVIECNDGFAMGHYGLNCVMYAKVISARWHQMVGLPDPFIFHK